MASFRRLVHFGIILCIWLVIDSNVGADEDTDPSCRCIDNYDSRASFHDVSCYGINTAEDVTCAANYLETIAAADINFRMTFTLFASTISKFPSEFLETYSVIGLVFDACKTPRIPKRIIRPVSFMLTTLQIRGSVIKKIPTNGLTDCIMLSSLLVQNSSVETVAQDAFQNLFNLQELDLRQNQLQNFSGFSGIDSLRMLNLAFNKISYISKGAFQNTLLLDTIFLNNNQLEALDQDTFGTLNKLEYLDLSGNRLYSFSGFSGIGILRMLNLSSNNIHSVDSDAFRELENLWMIYMDRNNLSVLLEGTFNPLDRNPDLTLISLEGNPLHCNCSVQWLQQWFEEHPKVKGKESTTCSSPMQGSLMSLDFCDNTITTTSIVTTIAPTTTGPWTSSFQTKYPSTEKKPPSNPPLKVDSNTSGSAMINKRTIELATIMGVFISKLYSSYFC